jgi:hypothetical protein
MNACAGRKVDQGLTYIENSDSQHVSFLPIDPREVHDEGLESMIKRGSDTSDDIARMQIEVYRRQSSGDRFNTAVRMTAMVRAMAAERIRAGHSDWGERDVARELLRLAFLPSSLPAGFR